MHAFTRTKLANSLHVSKHFLHSHSGSGLSCSKPSIIWRSIRFRRWLHTKELVHRIPWIKAWPGGLQRIIGVQTFSCYNLEKLQSYLLFFSPVITSRIAEFIGKSDFSRSLKHRANSTVEPSPALVSSPSQAASFPISTATHPPPPLPRSSSPSGSSVKQPDHFSMRLFPNLSDATPS